MKNKKDKETKLKETKPKEKKPKEKKPKEIRMTVALLHDEVKRLEKSIKKSDANIRAFKTQAINLESLLKRIIDKQTSEIKVLERKGKWGGYTGVFYINKKDNEKTVTSKALNHYGKYFEAEDFYKNKTLGLFISTPKGKSLVKILQDPEDRLKNRKNLHEDTVKTLERYEKRI